MDILSSKVNERKPGRERRGQAGSNFQLSWPRSQCCEMHAVPSAELSDSPEYTHKHMTV